MSAEHPNKIEITTKAEELLNRIVEKASVLREWEKISVLSGKKGGIEGTGDYGSYDSTYYSLFLTYEGLIEQRHVLQYVNAVDGFPYNEDATEYPVQPSYFLVQQYDPDEYNLKTLEGLLHQLQSRIL